MSEDDQDGREDRVGSIGEEAARLFGQWLADAGKRDLAAAFDAMCAVSQVGRSERLRGPVGESNLYRTGPRGEVLILPETGEGLLLGLGAALATGNHAAIEGDAPGVDLLGTLPPLVRNRMRVVPDWAAETEVAAILVEGDADRLAVVADRAARMMHEKFVVQPQFRLARLLRRDQFGAREISLEERVGHRQAPRLRYRSLGTSYLCPVRQRQPKRFSRRNLDADRLGIVSDVHTVGQ